MPVKATKEEKDVIEAKRVSSLKDVFGLGPDGNKPTAKTWIWVFILAAVVWFVVWG